MKTKTQITFLALVAALLVSLVFGSPALAQQTNDLVTCSGAACQWCDVIATVQNIFNTAVYLLFPIVTVYVAYSGVLYIMGSTAGSDKTLKKAKGTLTDAIIGLIICLLAFLIVNATITGLTGAKIENFINLDCSLIDTSPVGYPESPGDLEPPIVGPQTPPDEEAEGSITAESARALFARNQIAINWPNECRPGQTEGCTSVAGLREPTLNGAIRLRQQCGCPLMITGGTEDGHESGRYSHGRGYKLDFRLESTLNKFIEENPSQFRRVGNRGSHPEYIDAYGNSFVKEGNHWDVTFQN